MKNGDASNGTIKMSKNSVKKLNSVTIKKNVVISVLAEKETLGWN